MDRAPGHHINIAPQSEKLQFGDIAEVRTEKGSIYRYLENGKTKRFKAAENKQYEEQDALVYVPDFAWVSKYAPPGTRERLGENETIYVDILLEYVQNPRKDGKKYVLLTKRARK